ncbi:Mitochondrial ous recombination protein 1 [Wickerhamiella sorbophila]|uniref:Large ribosomal subunit protein mL67 n=1 Tax=Wickerhamiella sorbophila TaxID=45607 RepID=A0A2T0FD98_9ASCO|nr:Mitochondrial ous recombination protein 1 [Wickerhamiella sorbophila]PRT52974.1 Mitochondrial ous recombination protein 1 [Wickerhamiella sorbophila]
MSYRPVYGGLRSARWLRTFQYGPLVTAFRNLESGQVMFTQTLHPQQFYIDQLFKWPNWQNKKPVVRKDIWRPLAVAELPTHEEAVQLYRSLVELRKMRDMTQRDQARAWRKKSPEGNVWFWNQYRPTYTHEAVSDLVSAMSAMGLDKATIHWEHAYRRGDDKHWEGLDVSHNELPRHNPREQHVVLNRLRIDSLERAKEIQAEATKAAQAAARAAQEAGQPTPRGQRLEEARKVYERKQRILANTKAQREALLAARPELADLEVKKQAIAKAEAALAEAKASYDHFLPHGQRGAAKAPIKLRDRALRQAKRVYRQAKKRVAAQSNKRRVPQPKSRMLRK